MAEVKNTKKKPVAKKSAQNTAATATEELEKTAPETAEQQIEKSVKKPAKKKLSDQTEKTMISEQQGETAAAVTDGDTEITEPQKAENATESPVENVEQPVAIDDLKADEPKAENDIEQKEPVVQSNKPAKASGKKFVLSKNMIIILSCVLALVIIGVILAVCLTSCKSDDNNNKKYTVTFVVDGEVTTTYTLSAGEKISEPKDNPTKDMFAFDGWYLINPNNSSQRQKFVFGTTVSQNITLVAIFKGESSVKVEFNPNGGTFADNKQVELIGVVGDVMTKPLDEPTYVGYLFDGWYTEAECYNQFSFGAYPVENFTLYAGWRKDTENYVYVTYYGNGEQLRVDPVLKGEDIVKPNLFDDNDDIVAGDWLTEENNLNKPYTEWKATSDLDLYVTYYTKGLKFNVTRYDATVTGYDGTATEVIVPSMYEGKEVKSIGSYAFYRTGQLSAVTSIKLPKTIDTIDEGAFYDCQYLVSVNLTYTVTSIGADAFYRNIRLRTVGDISSVEGEKLGAGAFNGCKELREITFSGLLTKIGDYTFNDCASLSEILLPDALQTIGSYAFSGCTALKSVELGAFVQSISDNAFAGCSSLAEVFISKTLDGNGEVVMQGNPFVDCRNVTVYVPSELLEAYQNNTNNTQFKDKFAAR